MPGGLACTDGLSMVLPHECHKKVDPERTTSFHQKVLHLLKGIKQAEYDHDFARAAGMHGEQTQSLDTPLANGASVVVPDVTQVQKSLIYRKLIVALSPGSSYRF